MGVPGVVASSSAAALAAGSFIGGAVAGAAGRVLSYAMSGDANAAASPQANGATRVERAYDAASSFGTFIFGERKTDSDRIRDAQRDLEHDARHFDRQRQIAERNLAAQQRTVQAMVKKGETGPALRRALRQQQRNMKHAERSARTAERLENGADAIGATEGKLRLMSAAATQADALVRTNAILESQGSAMELAKTMARETERANTQLEVIEDAFEDADDADAEANEELDLAYAAAVEVALCSTPSVSRSAVAVAAAPNYFAGEAVAAVSGGGRDVDAELAERLANLKQ